MDVIGFDSLPNAIRDVGAILCFRSLPIVGYALLTKQIVVARKIGIGLAYTIAAVALRVWSLPAIVWLGVAYCYFAAAACGVPIAARLLRANHVTRGGAFSASASAFLALPCLLVPGPARATALILGWDIMLSSYSYCVEVARSDDDPPLRECLFFLLVNPALVYPRRGVRVGGPTLDVRGVTRGVQGLLTLLATLAFLAPLCAAVEDQTLGIALMRGPVAATVAFGVSRFLLEYGRQSGLASLQIGMMRQLGHEIPERYRWPIAARNPLDFWQRWNTYVSGWLLRYVFWPVTFRYRGNGRSWRLVAAQAGGILATFVSIGLLHDMYMYAVGFDATARSLRAFSAVGLVVVCWLALTWGWRRWMARIPTRDSIAGAVAVVSRVSFWAIAVGCIAWGWQ
jgi:hypothetical protein